MWSASLESVLFYKQEEKNGKEKDEEKEVIFLTQNTEFEVWFDCGTVCERLQSWNESSSVGTVFFIHGSELISQKLFFVGDKNGIGCDVMENEHNVSIPLIEG